MHKPDPATLIQQGGLKLGIRLDGQQVQSFLIYLHELKRWNRAMNLTSIREDALIVEEHFLDSLGGLKSIGSRQGVSVLDLGAGAGFPGIPLKLLRPDLDLRLIESVKKKIAFLHHLVGTLGLTGVTIMGGRIEEAQKKAPAGGLADTILARALTSPRKVIELADPLLSVEGRLILYLGPSQLKGLSIGPEWTRQQTSYVLPFSGKERTILALGKRGRTG